MHLSLTALEKPKLANNVQARPHYNYYCWALLTLAHLSSGPNPWATDW